MNASMRNIGHKPGAEQKILARLDAFQSKGWSEVDLWGLAPSGYEGLAFRLRPLLTIGRVFSWCCELLTPINPNGYSSRYVYFRTADEAWLLTTVGPHVRPAQLKVRGYS